MAIAPISKRKLAAIKSGAVKLHGSTTFERMSAEEYRAKDQKQKRALWDALYGNRKPGKSPREQAMAEADKWFSQWIRLRDSNADGRVQCVTCSHTDHWRQLQCGHYVERGTQSTRYDEKNCNTQCKGCNWNGGKRGLHKLAIDRKYGPGTAEALDHKGHFECKRGAKAFLDIAEDYRGRVEAIRYAQPTKFKAA